MSKYRYAINLQQFADGDDDGFDGGADDTSSFDDTSDEIEMDPADFNNSSSEDDDTDAEADQDTTDADESTEDTPAETDDWKLDYKFLGEDKVLTDKEKARELIQKGENYDRAIERAARESAQAARDSYIAEQGYEWNGQAIKTEADYKAAVAERELMQKYQNLPPELVEEIMAGRRDREQTARERQAAEEKAANDRQLSDFLAVFQEMHERPYDPKVDKIAPEVWAASQNGTPLRYAYIDHFNKQLRSQLKISKQNESNARKAPVGGVTSGGTNKKESVDPFLEGFNSV